MLESDIKDILDKQYQNRKFKTSKRDKWLFAGFIVSCIVLIWLSWNI
jgi:hypothetical protein